jgi:hypothetical protein
MGDNIFDEVKRWASTPPDDSFELEALQNEGPQSIKLEKRYLACPTRPLSVALGALFGGAPPWGGSAPRGLRTVTGPPDSCVHRGQRRVPICRSWNPRIPLW